LVGLGVERSRRSPTAGEEEAARVRCEREGHGMGEQGGESVGWRDGAAAAGAGTLFLGGRSRRRRCSTDQSDLGLGSSLLGLPNTNSKLGLDRGIEEKARPNLRQLDLLQISLFELKLERSTCILFSGPAGKQGNDFLANLHSVLLTIRNNVFSSHDISTSHQPQPPEQSACLCIICRAND